MDWIVKLLAAFGLEDISTQLRSIALQGYRHGRMNAQRDVEEDIDVEPDIDAMLNIGVRTHALSETTIARAKGGLAFDAQKLQAEIDAAIKGGMSEKEALGQIEGRVKGLFEDNFKDWELERLVRDQYLVATKEGRRSGWQDGGVKFRVWRMHLDSKTGDDSKRMNGQIVGIDEPYVDPKTGDKYMVTHIRPNDRCYEEPLWEMPETKMKKGLVYEKSFDSVSMDVEKVWTEEARKKALEARRSKMTPKDWEEVKSFRKSLENKSGEELQALSKGVLVGNGIVREAVGDWYQGVEMEKLEAHVTNLFGMSEGKARKENAHRYKQSKFGIDRNNMVSFLKMRACTQAFLKLAYPDSGVVTVYRGVDADTWEKFKDSGLGNSIEFDTYNVSCWTTDPEVAKNFLRKQGHGIVAKADVPKEQIVLHHVIGDAPFQSESEITVIGNKFSAELFDVMDKGTSGTRNEQGVETEEESRAADYESKVEGKKQVEARMFGKRGRVNVDVEKSNYLWLRENRGSLGQEV